MNYMPYQSYVWLDDDTPQLDAIVLFLQDKISMSSSVQRQRAEIMIEGGGNFATVRLTKPSSSLLQSIENKSVRTRLKHATLLEICSGPHYDMDYLPVFVDVQFALFQFPGAFLLSDELEIDRWSEDAAENEPVLERVFSYDCHRLLALAADNENSTMSQYASLVVLEMIQHFSPADSIPERSLTAPLQQLLLNTEDEELILRFVKQYPRRACDILLNFGLLTQKATTALPLLLECMHADIEWFCQSKTLKEAVVQLQHVAPSEPLWLRLAAAYILTFSNVHQPLLRLLTAREDVELLTHVLAEEIFWEKCQDDKYVEKIDSFLILQDTYEETFSVLLLHIHQWLVQAFPEGEGMRALCLSCGKRLWRNGRSSRSASRGKTLLWLRVISAPFCRGFFRWKYTQRSRLTTNVCYLKIDVLAIAFKMKGIVDHLFVYRPHVGFVCCLSL